MSDAEVKDLNQISKKDIYHTPSGKYIQFIHDHSEKHLMRGNSYRTEVIGYSRARALLLRHLMNLKKKLLQSLKMLLEMPVQVLIQEQLIQLQWKDCLHVFIMEQKLIFN